MTRRRARRRPGKHDGGGPEVGHGPLDVVLDEVGRGCGQRGFVPSEEHTFNGVCQGPYLSLASAWPSGPTA